MDKPDIPALKQEVAELTAGMLNRKLFAILAIPQKQPDDIWPHLPDHLRYMLELEEKGTLFASGPFMGESGKPEGAGLTIVRAETKEQAEAIAEKDPLTRSGFRRCEIFEWHLMEGRIEVSLDLARGALRFE